MTIRSANISLGHGPELRDRRIHYQIETRNEWWWILTVFIEVYYVFGQARETDPAWSSGEISQWKDRFEETAERTWSRRWHIKATDYTGGSLLSNLFSDPQPLPIVEVRVDIQEVDAGSVPPDRLWQVRVLHDSDGPQYSTHARYSFAEYPGDEEIGLIQVWQSSIECSDIRYGYTQSGTDHEVGHMLGLPHPRGMGNNPGDYGENDSERARMMGYGHAVTRADYNWALRIMRVSYPDYGWHLINPGPWMQRPEICYHRRPARSRTNGPFKIT